MVVENLIDNFNHTDFLNEIILKIDLKRSAPVCSIGMLRMTKVLKLSNWNDYFDRCFENFSSRNLKDIDGIFQGLTKV